MPYAMHRVFFATPMELDEERTALMKLIQEFNETYAMPRNLLLISVCLPPTMADKRVYQAAILENIRDARYFVLLLEDSWGPPTRDFERDLAMARKYAADGGHSCREVVVLFKKPLLPHKVDAGVLALKQSLGSGLMEFDTLDELKSLVRPILERWLAETATSG